MKKTKKLSLNMETLRILNYQTSGHAMVGQAKAPLAEPWSTGVCTVFLSCYKDCP
jgi:hypothetical protein